MQAYVYIRFSTPKQEKGASKERQAEDCLAYCARKGWPVVEVLEDLGKSAWKGDHLKSGQLGRFAERVHAGEIAPGSVLVVEKLDRLSRQEVRTTQRWLEDLCAAGIAIATVSGDRVYDDESLRGSLMATLEVLLIGKLAHDESQNKSDRIGDSWRRKQEKAKAGVVMTTKTPGWLRVTEDRSRIEEIPERVALVREIYELAANGYGARAIAQTLNKRGAPSFREAWKDGQVVGWTHGFVGDLLLSPSVEGEYHPNYRAKKRNISTAPILGYYPRVVDADLVARARAAITSRKGQGGRYRQNMSNLFQGVCVCGACGGRMTTRRTRRTLAGGTRVHYNYLQCANAMAALKCEQREFFDYAKFEPAALDAILHLALNDSFFQKAASSVQLSIKVAEMEKELALARDAARRLVRLLATMDDMPEVEDELRATKQAMHELEQKIVSTRNELTVANGRVSPDEHLRRVIDVRSVIEDDDEDVRIAARLKVNEAMRAVVDQVRCQVDQDGNRAIVMILVGGLMAFKFDNEGTLLQQVDLTSQMLFEEAMAARKAERSGATDNIRQPAMSLRHGVTGQDPRRNAQLDALLRRLRQSS